MNSLLFAHAGEAHDSAGQSFFHVVAAWYLAVPVFTILLTIVVAVVVRHILDRYERTHRKAHKKTSKKHKDTESEDS